MERVRDALAVRHYSTRTSRAYCGWIVRFIRFHNLRHPADLGPEAVGAFLTHLATERRVSASTQNQALAGLLFLYGVVLEQPIDAARFVRAKRATHVPVVLTPREVAALLDHLSGVPKLVASLLYGAGLRLLECLKLRVKDLDFERCEITVRDAKGRQDRLAPLPESLIPPLRAHLGQVQAQHS